MRKIHTSPLIIISTFLIISIFFSCSKECENITPPPVLREIETIFVDNCDPHVISECIEDIDRSNVRIQNYSPYEICNIEFASDTIYNFGSLLPGESTCYRAMTTYNYPSSIRYEYADTSAFWFAFDFVGETLLEPGYYNYNLSFLDTEYGFLQSAAMTASEDDLFPINNDLRNCTTDNKDDGDSASSTKNLRINNQSIFDICDITYTNNDNRSKNFGSLLKGETSSYIPMLNVSKNRIKLELTIDNKVLVLDHRDPIVSDQVSNANNTLNITISSLTDRGIKFSLVED